MEGRSIGRASGVAVDFVPNIRAHRGFLANLDCVTEIQPAAPGDALFDAANAD